MFALVCDEWAAGMEGATGRGIDGAGDFTGEKGVGWFSMGVWLRDRVQEGAGIGVLGRVEELIGGCVFDDFSEIHDSDVIADVLDDG